MLIAARILAAAGAASGQAPDCGNPRSTLEESQCADMAQRAVEGKLNELYQRVLTTFGDQAHVAARNKLLAAQRLWVKFRDADCAAVYENWMGGTVRKAMSSECMRKHAEQRIKELEDFGTLY